MPSTHLNLQYHIVFSTKDRFRWIGDGWRSDLHRFVGGCVRTLGGIPLEIGGVDDHLHLLAGLRATHAVADVLMEVKKVSSRWVHEHIGLQQFRWQEGYGAFTVSDGDVAGIRRYVATQEEHHRRRSFQEEYRALLVEHGVAFDERYLW